MSPWRDDYLWWQRGVIYQIYPRSFQDTNGDGIGDLNGIRRRLDYLKWLGVEGIWISPFYPSPMKDFGYDVSDYVGVHPLFGTMEDFDRLLAEAHERGLKLILDLVPNHSSDQHPWFQEACRSRNSEKRNWYIWADAKEDGGPPNNWLNEFASANDGSAWEWHEPTGQYYYHAFLKEQPDLNWRNPDVRRAMEEVMRFWLDKGVDGFRVDVMWHMIKDERLRDNPPNPDYDPEHDSPYKALLPVYSTDQPEVHDVVAGMRRVMDEYDERLMIGEIYLPISELVAYYGAEESEAHLPFNFQLVGAPWDAAHLRAIIDEYEGSVPDHEWPNWVLGNHDQPRIASRVGDAQARVAAMLLLTLRGTPTMYYGDELGMRDGRIAAEKVVDPRELNCPGRGLGRDPHRTPMQWNAEKFFGFSEGNPWLPVPEDAREMNVERERENPDSMLSLYRRLINLRQSEPALCVGGYEPVPADPPLLAYRRFYEGADSFLVALNFSGESQRLKLPRLAAGGRVEVSTHSVHGERQVEGHMELGPNEAVLVRWGK